jgi:aryl-alcohol dehydrogenase-like predicted oxidoreductase
MLVPSGDSSELYFARYSKENFPNILKLADNLKRVGEQYNATAGQVGLAWLLAQGEDVIPIPGTKNIKVSSPIFAYNLDVHVFELDSISRRTSLL